MAIFAHGIELLMFIVACLALANDLGIVAWLAAVKKRRLIALFSGLSGLALGCLLAREYGTPHNIDAYLAWFSIPLSAAAVVFAIFQKPRVA